MCPQTLLIPIYLLSFTFSPPTSFSYFLITPLAVFFGTVLKFESVNFRDICSLCHETKDQSKTKKGTMSFSFISFFFLRTRAHNAIAIDSFPVLPFVCVS